MSLFTSLLGPVVGLFGKSKQPAAPAAPATVPLSEFKSALDDPLTSLYAQQALADLGYKATKKEAEYDPYYYQTRKEAYAKNLGKYDWTKDEYDRYVKDWGQAAASKHFAQINQKRLKTPESWDIEQGSEPEAYARLRENYGKELGAQQAKLFGNMASRGILRSGATADAARQMSEATGSSIANAIEAQRQGALDRLNQLVQSERSQQARAASVANNNAQTQYGAGTDAYNIAQQKRTQGMSELSDILGGIGNIKFGGRKKSSDSYQPSAVWDMWPL